MSEANNGPKQEQEKNSQVEAEAEEDDQNTSEAMKQTMLNTEDGTMHQGKSDERSAETGIQGIETEASLQQAVPDGDLQLCQLLLRQGANPNTSSDGNPLLPQSARVGNLEIVKTLIKHVEFIHATDSDNQDALQQASMNGDRALVAYLLDHGANVHHVDDNG